MDVGSSSGASSLDVLASGSGAATAGGVFCFCADGFGGFGLQISATSAGRSSGGARATDAISAAVGLTSPESTFCRVPGTASSAASSPRAKCSASFTKVMALMKKLFEQNRIDDAKKASEDAAYYDRLLKELGIN